MSPPDRAPTRHIRRTSVALALAGALLLPWPAGADALLPQAGAGEVSGGEVAHLGGPVLRLPEGARGAPGGVSGVAGALLSLVLLVAAANVAGMLLARAPRLAGPPPVPPSVRPTGGHRPTGARTTPS